MRSSYKKPQHALAVPLAAVVSGALVCPVASADDVRLDEIVVTAQKRAENLQTVPLALSVYSADTLQSQNIASLGDLKFRVPSLVYDEFSAGQPRYYIRGIGNNLQSGAVDEDVGVFIDGVYMGRPEMSNNDFLDIESVEVLRGPQGTLFGRNVVGGAITFNTRKPDEQVRAGGNFTVGNYNQTDVAAYVSGPISDKVFGKIAATSRNRDGFYFNTTTNNDVEDAQFAGARGALRFLPNDTLDIQLNADVSRRRGTGSWAYLYRTGPVFSAPAQPDPYRGAHYTDDGVADIDNQGASLNIDWETALGTVTSITAFRDSKMAVRFNTTGDDVGELGDPPVDASNLLFVQGYHADTEQFTQELRIASPATERLTWVAGAYFFHNDVDYGQENTYRFTEFFSEGVFGTESPSKTTAYAVFANAAFDITDQLAIQAGVRYSYDEKKIHYTSYGQSFLGPYTIDGVPVAGYDVTAEKDWDAVTPAVSLNYQLTPDVFFYATASKGFKSGGFTSGSEATEARVVQTPFNPEFAWNYEVGAKTEWLDRRMRFNVSAFHIDYTDLQLRILVQLLPLPSLPVEIVGNAGKTVSQGVETELDFAVTSALDVYGSYTFTDTEIKEMVLAGVDQAGHRLAKAPKHKVFVGGSYTVPLGEKYTATARVDYTYSSDYHSNPTNDPVELVPLRRNLDAGLRFETEGGRWGIELWGKNLTDEFHPSAVTSVFGTGYAVPLDPPRTYGATVRFQFD